MTKAKTEATDAKLTPGNWTPRIYASSADEIARLHDVGLEPIRMLTNEGQVPLMAVGADGETITRVALVDAHAKYKRAALAKAAGQVP